MNQMAPKRIIDMLAEIPFIGFVRDYCPEIGRNLLVIFVTSSVMQGLVVFIITRAVVGGSGSDGGSGGGGTSHIPLFPIYALAVMGYLLARRKFLNESATGVETAVANIRDRIANQLQEADLLWFERVGLGHCRTVLTTDTVIITNGARTIFGGLAGSLISVLVAGYIIWLSPAAGIAVVVLLGVCVGLLLYRYPSIKERVQHVEDAQNRYFGLFDELFKGFCELKMNRQRSDGFYEEGLCSHAQEVAEGTRSRESLMLTSRLLYDVALYGFMAFFIFVFPSLVSMSSSETTQIILAVLFLILPVSELIGGLLALLVANESVINLVALEGQLKLEPGAPAIGQEPCVIPPPTTLALENAAFTYRDDAGTPLFTVGPISMTVSSGSLLFIVGGNGSGKSTLLKLLAGLYTPESGALRIDEADLDDTSRRGFREHVSIVFTDFHLFDRLYGQEDICEETVAKWLALMKIDHKTSFKDGRFTTLNLSSGQRKRLAIVAALIEDRPIVVFDEIAADQDPVFRDWIYRDLLKQLKEQNKIVIVVSHDDRYFHLADQVLKLNRGVAEAYTA